MKRIKILGAGLICIDIVHDGSSTKIMNGGSCANVISVLAQVGFDCSIIRESYTDPLESFLSSTLVALGVKEHFYKTSKTSVPRIIEDLSGNKHSFFTTCPCCGKKLLTLKLPTEAEIDSVSELAASTDVLYCDRTSSGLRGLMSNVQTRGGIVFYEPNSARNMSGFLDTAFISDIVKFSRDRISMDLAERIRTNNPQIKLIISTDGAQGLAFSHRTAKGTMSPWIMLPSVFDGPIVDASGAGDWLTAGFLSELLRDRNALPIKRLQSVDAITDMLNNGMKYSKLCCAAIGAQGFFYSPEYSEAFNKLSSRKNKLQGLLPVDCYMSNMQHCPVCFSAIQENDPQAAS